MELSNERLDELIEWTQSYHAKAGSPRADTLLALQELKKRRQVILPERSGGNSTDPDAGAVVRDHT